jgi:small subunit ribosomal protein S10e
MLIPKKNRVEVYKYLFKEGVLYAKKDYNAPKHPEIDVPNLQVIKLMQSFKSKEYVKESFAWRHYYWYLTNDGIEHLRTYLNLPSEIVPATLKKSARPPTRPMGGAPGGDRPPRGPPREGERPRFGDREGYRSGAPRGAPGAFGGEKGGAPGEYRPEFRGPPRGGFGRGGGGFGGGAPGAPAAE